MRQKIETVCEKDPILSPDILPMFGSPSAVQKTTTNQPNAQTAPPGNRVYVGSNCSGKCRGLSVTLETIFMLPFTSLGLR